MHRTCPGLVLPSNAYEPIAERSPSETGTHH
jgi:hypothetical protein